MQLRREEVYAPRASPSPRERLVSGRFALQGQGAQEPFVPLVLALCVASGASGTGPSGRWERRVLHASG